MDLWLDVEYLESCSCQLLYEKLTNNLRNLTSSRSISLDFNIGEQCTRKSKSGQNLKECFKGDFWLWDR